MGLLAGSALVLMLELLLLLLGAEVVQVLNVVVGWVVEELLLLVLAHWYAG